MSIDRLGRGPATRTWRALTAGMVGLVTFTLGCSRRAEIPPLNFNSASGLVHPIQVFRLGMSLPDALRADPQLRNWYPDAPASPTKLDCQLTTASWLPFHDTLEFSHGRLVWLESSVDNVDPAEAREFEANLILTLGRPTRQLYAGPDEKILVWISGDVRVRYEDARWGGPTEDASPPARALTLDFAAYAAWISYIESPQEPSPHKADFVAYERRTWGDGPLVSPSAALPRSVESFALGMTPEQSSAMFPSGQVSGNTHESVVTIPDAWEIHFWDDRAYSIVRRWSNIGDWRSEFPAMRKQLIRQFGPPLPEFAYGPGMSVMQWDNASTEMEYRLVSGTGPSDPSSIMLTLIDWGTVTAKDQYEYQASPHGYTHFARDSFF